MSEPRSRRRVFVTAGLSASAAVLAMAVQAGAFEDGGAPGASYGDSAAADPTAEGRSGADDGADAGAE